MSTIILSQKKIDELKKQLQEVRANYDRQAEEHARGGGAAESWTETAAFRATSMTLEKKAKDLEKILKSARVLPEKTQGTEAQIGTWIDLKNDKGIAVTYRLVHPIESSPENSLLSIESPLGSALLGKRVGDSVIVNDTTFTISKIS